MELQADPKLLSLLEKVNNPIEKLQVRLIVHGIYGFPDEWRITDETNPGIFANAVKYEGQDLYGKIKARELTEKEKYEELQKNKKGKKDVKSPEEEESLKRILQQEEEDEQQKKLYMATLDDKESAYFAIEDKFKSASIMFDEPQEFILENVRQLEDSINQNRNFIYFCRQPAVSEEEIVKLKKGKTKNLNNQELTQIMFKGEFDLSQFLEPGVLSVTTRCFLQQEQNNDVPKYPCERFYIKVQMDLDLALTPLVADIQPFYVEPIKIQNQPSKKQCVAAFQYDITQSMQALAEEYGKLFQSDQKAKTQSTTMTVQKKQELQKKKEQFLQEINSSGKYKILKDRLHTSIVRVCIDKFSKEGLFVGVNKDEQDRLFAELYVFLMEEMQKTLGTFIGQNRDDIHEDLVASFDQNIRERDRVFQTLFKETELERYIRLASEYETINQVDQAIKYYTNMVLIDRKSAYNFAKYCLIIQKFKDAEELMKEVRQVEWNKEYELLMASLYIRRDRFKEATQIIAALLEKEPINTLYNLFMSFILKLQGNENLSLKYARCTQRIFMRTMGLLTKSYSKQQQDPHKLPNFKQQMLEQQEKAKKAPVLTNEQIDQIYMELVEYFASRHLLDLAEGALAPIQDKTTPKITIIKAQIYIFQGNYQEAFQLISKILQQNPKNHEVYLIKGSLCYQTEQFYEAEETFLKALSLQYKHPFKILLRLGYLYIKRKSWQDAKVIFERALDATPNSSLSWLGLGIAYLRLKNPLAEECFQQANIYEPFNGDVWGYMALNCLFHKRSQQAKQCLIRMEQTEVNDLELLQELGDEMFKCQDFESSNKLYSRVYLSQMNISSKGQLLKKLGQVNTALRKFEDALSYFNKSLEHLEGENEKLEVTELMRRI